MNIILVIIDSLRKDHVGAYGNSWIKTPHLNAIAAESVIFEQCYPESLPTIPVRRALYTGLRSFPFRNFNPVKGDPVRLPGWQPIPEEQPTITEILADNGYRTALITDVYHQLKPSMNFIRGFHQWDLIRGQVVDFYKSSRKGIDTSPYLTEKMRGSGAERMLIQYLSNNRDRHSELESFPAQVFMRASDWLVENADDCDEFFLVIDCFDPHEPFDPPSEYYEKYDPGYQGKSIILPKYGYNDYLNKDELQHMRALYAGEVTLVDHWFGNFIDKVRQMQLLNNTILVVISDHGVLLGERGVIGKVPWGMNRELMETVLMIKHPNIPAKRIKSYVQNYDLTSTIFELINKKKLNIGEGKSLVPLMNNDTNQIHPYVTSILGNYVWIQTNDYMMTCQIGGKDCSLFDLNSDPNQRHNIVTERMNVAKDLYNIILEDAGGNLPDYPLCWPSKTFGAEWFIRYQQEFNMPEEMIRPSIEFDKS